MDMDFESFEALDKRLESLEREQIERLSAEIAQDCVITALIATHPDAQALKKALQAIAEYRLIQFGDIGFERDSPASSTAAAAAGLRAQLDEWLRKLP